MPKFLFRKLKIKRSCPDTRVAHDVRGFPQASLPLNLSRGALMMPVCLISQLLTSLPKPRRKEPIRSHCREQSCTAFPVPKRTSSCLNFYMDQNMGKIARRKTRERFWKRKTLLFRVRLRREEAIPGQRWMARSPLFAVRQEQAGAVSRPGGVYTKWVHYRNQLGTERLPGSDSYSLTSRVLGFRILSAKTHPE